MIDLHSHLLPGVDDGPATVAEAVELVRAMAADGASALVATPHRRHPLWWNGDDGPLTDAFERLRRGVEDAFAADGAAAPRLELGAEVHVDPAFLDDLPPAEPGDSKDPRGPGEGIVGLAGSRWILLELHRWESTVDPVALVHEAVVGGWRPILAHPEEIEWLADDEALLERLVERGAVLQITAATLVGERGRPRQQLVRRLVDAGWVAFVASDAHHAVHRPPRLGAARRELEYRFGEETAHRLLVDNPRAVLEDRPLPATEALPDATSAPVGASTAGAGDR